MPLPTTLTTWLQCCVLHSEETSMPCKAGIWAWSLSVQEGNSFYHHLRNVISNTHCPAIQLSIKTILLNTITPTLQKHSKDYSTQYSVLLKTWNLFIHISISLFHISPPSPVGISGLHYSRACHYSIKLCMCTSVYRRSLHMQQALALLPLLCKLKDMHNTLHPPFILVFIRSFVLLKFILRDFK